MTERPWTTSVRANRNSSFWELRDDRGYTLGDACGSGVTIVGGSEALAEANCVLWASAPALFEALTGLLQRYVSLASSGDCGHWDPEAEPEVIAARAALLLSQGRGE